MKNYQRRHLRAPYREHILYADDDHVLRGRAINISEGGLYLDRLPSFPAKDEVNLLISIPVVPLFKNFSLLKLHTFTPELYPRNVIRAKAQMVRREELSQDLDNIFKARIGLEFTNLSPQALKHVADYVSTFSSNLIYLQTLIDSFNTDDETKARVRVLAKILGYSETEKIAALRSSVTSDYRSLQWI